MGRSVPPSSGTPRLAAVIALALAAGGCSSDPAPTDNVVVVPTRAEPPRILPTPSPQATATTVPSPTPAAIPTPMRPTKAFTDPPLPPELRDDGGLVPLPPPPANAPR